MRILTAPIALNNFSMTDLGRLVTHVMILFTLNTFRFVGKYAFLNMQKLWTSMRQTFRTRLRVTTVHQHSHPTRPASPEDSAWLLVHPNGKKEVLKSCCHAESKEFTIKLACWIEQKCLAEKGTAPFTIQTQSCDAVEEHNCIVLQSSRGDAFLHSVTSNSYVTRTSKRSAQLQSRDFRFCIIDPECWGLKLENLMEFWKPF